MFKLSLISVMVCAPVGTIAFLTPNSPTIATRLMEKQDSPFFTDESSSSSSSSSITNETTTTAQFGDVVSLNRPATTDSAASTVQFGDVVSLKKKPSDGIDVKETVVPTSDAPIVDLEERKKKNVGVAVISVVLALTNYLWQYFHPLAPIQILYTLEQSSAPITVIGDPQTNKPTVVDFWAPWCENCKTMAATLQVLETEYAGKGVNFVMVNGDNPSNWPLIDAFHVDAIPHLAMVEADGTVDTALIGPVPIQWLEQDLNTMLSNVDKPDEEKMSLPYQMLTSAKPQKIQISLENPSTTASE